MTRVILITGCSSGIGLETALAFARGGDRVCATMRDLSGAEKLNNEADKNNVTVSTFALDVTKPASFAPLVGKIVEQFGRIDVLVNNAGVLPIGAFEDVSEDALRAVMETNFFGPALLSRAVLPTMRAQGDGYIINISSLSGMASKGGDAVYAASKFALEGLTEGFRNEVARWGIKTALIEPGQYATKIFRGSNSMDEGASGSPYRMLNGWLCDEMAKGAGKGNDPKSLADQIVKVSLSNGKRLRWPADDTAHRVMAAVFAQNDEARSDFLREVGEMDWWIDGRNKPE